MFNLINVQKAPIAYLIDEWLHKQNISSVDLPDDVFGYPGFLIILAEI